jgi:hypothetical protein
LKRFIPRLLGKLAVAWAVKRWGNKGAIFSDQVYTSETYGNSWSMEQYLVAWAVATWVPKVFGRFLNASEFRTGAWDLILTKAIWTEGIARSDWAVQQFGATGDVQYDPTSGQMMIESRGQLMPMQGPIVKQSPLDGLVGSSPLDGTGSYGYGHLLPAGVSAQTAETGRQSGSGYVSNYHAAYADS